MDFNQELDAMWEKDNRIAQLEEELAKVTARYNCVRDMTPEDFGNLSTINDDFDRKIDELIKERIAQLEADLAAIKQQFINYENACALDMMIEYERLQTMIMSIKEQQ